MRKIPYAAAVILTAAYTAATLPGNTVLCNNFRSDYASADFDPVALDAKKDGNVDDRFIQSANSYISLIPESVLVTLAHDGWDIYVTDKDINSYFYHGKYGSVAGTTEYGPNNIYIEDRFSAVWRALIHEVGHAVDVHYDFASNSDEFKKIFEEESENFVSSVDSSDTQAQWNSNEFFAEVFREAVINPENVKARTPKAYEYVSGIIAKTEKENSRDAGAIQADASGRAEQSGPGVGL